MDLRTGSSIFCAWEHHMHSTDRNVRRVLELHQRKNSQINCLSTVLGSISPGSLGIILPTRYACRSRERDACRSWERDALFSVVLCPINRNKWWTRILVELSLMKHWTVHNVQPAKPPAQPIICLLKFIKWNLPHVTLGIGHIGNPSHLPLQELASTGAKRRWIHNILYCC